MKSVQTIYKIGHGPSSSHTMGPANAAVMFKKSAKRAVSFRVELFGSLAATGKGHLTDVSIKKELACDDVEFVWKADEVLQHHTNAMRFTAFDKSKKQIKQKVFYSIGGGEIVAEGKKGGIKRGGTLYKKKHNGSNSKLLKKKQDTPFGNMFLHMKMRSFQNIWKRYGIR